MPYQNAVMPHRNELGELATAIGACNNVYYMEGSPRRLYGTNTDRTRIKGCLLENSSKSAKRYTSPALIVGAGCASRTAVCALASHLDCPEIYVLNQDDQVVADLTCDSKKLPPIPSITHVKTLEHAQQCQAPYYVLVTVPDRDPKTAVETWLLYFDIPSRGSRRVCCLKCGLSRERPG